MSQVRSTAALSTYALDPALPVLLRPDGAVQVGWDPRRAVLVRPPGGFAAAELAALLRSMRSPTPLPDLQRRAVDCGLQDADGLTNLVAQLVSAGIATECGRSRGRAPSVRVHGRGPLTELLVESLRCSGARIAHSSQPHAAVSADDVDLVVLSDYLVADPRIVRDLHEQGVAHLLVRVRDGIGLVGPLVIPGVTSCLGCADLHRSDRDAAWPAVGRAAARHRRQRRPGHRAGDRGAGAQPGRPGHPGRARATPPSPVSRRRRWTPRWSSTSAPVRSWRAGGRGIRVRVLTTRACRA